MIDDRTHWYVACVKSCAERRVADELGRLGYSFYLPVRRELHQWSDRKKLVETLVVPRYIFINCTASERQRPLAEIPGMYKYLGVSDGGLFRPAVIPDAEMDTFISMVEKSGRKVCIENAGLRSGDRVKVISGPLAGHECELTDVRGKRCLAVQISMLGTAIIELDMDDLRKLN
ncbi:MAG: UpxY family transcription antiterminator [Bacteroidales bacterium]|nr:UpxY family transcription antiterminator [Bacteroidales bacterium]